MLRRNLVYIQRNLNRCTVKLEKEAYDIGHDYAQHAVSITPGQDGYDPNYQGGSYKPAVDGTSGESSSK